MMRTKLHELQQDNSMAMMIEEGGNDGRNERVPKDGGAVYRRQCTVENEQVECVCGKESTKARKVHTNEKKLKGETKGDEREEKKKKFKGKGKKRRKLQQTFAEEFQNTNVKKKKSKNTLKEEQMKFHKVEKENSLLREQLNQASNERSELLEINSSLWKKVKSQEEQLMKSTQEVAGLVEKSLELKQTMEVRNKKLLLMQKKLDGMEDMMKIIDKKRKMKEKNLVQRIVARVCSRS